MGGKLRTARGVIVLMVGALIAVGCGHSNNDAISAPLIASHKAAHAAKPKPKAPQTPATAAPAHPRNALADLAAARAAVLTAADLPEYEASPVRSSSNTVVPPALNAMFVNCMHADVSVFAPTSGDVSAGSPDFKNGTTQVSASITIGAAKPEVDAAWAILARAQTAECMKRLFAAIIFSTEGRSGVTMGPPSVDRFVDVDGGDRGMRFVVSVAASTRGIELTVNIEMFLVQRGRAELTLTAITIGPSYPRDAGTALLQKMVARLGSEPN